MLRPLLKLLTTCTGLAMLPLAAHSAGSPTERLHALFESSWEQDLVTSPLSATYFGDTRFNDRWPDLSAAARAREEAQQRERLRQLRAIDRQQLPAVEQLNFDLFEKQLQAQLDLVPHQAWAYEMTAREGPQSLNELVELMPFQTVADFEAWLQRLRTLPTYLEQYAARMKEAALAGRTQPRFLMERVLPQLQLQIPARVEDSPFFERFKQLPPSIPAAERERLSQTARTVIAEQVLPAYRRFEAFFRSEYLPACRSSVGIWDTPGGAAYYANRVQSHTTTRLTPDEIHAIGLKEVARILVQMQAVMDQLGFKGTRQEFFEQLRSDPKHYHANADELFRAYVVTTKMIEPELPKLFGRLYRTPVGVRAIPMTSAPNTTTAYYSGPSIDGRRPGYFYVNLYRPEVRPKYEIEVLTVHEAIPGHHLQIALAQERSDLPKFRRFASDTAYLEGWALYAERLGYELGLYQDPYSRFGQLTYDMWRAVRLVVDTGIHAKRWSREQAIAYFKDHAAKTEADIINEVDRYIGWPGQALAYKIGQLRILELRQRAETALGSGFDIRGFHDMLLEEGSLPLDVLEQRVMQWTEDQRRSSKYLRPSEKTPS